MFILNLSMENWNGNINQEILLENPDWEKIETAIRELNGITKTLVTLAIDEDVYMSIGGGELSQYIVNVTFDNENFYNLVKPTITEQIQKLIIGGQEGKYPAKMLVDLETVLLAAQTFADLGELERSLCWEEDQNTTQSNRLIEVVGQT